MTLESTLTTPEKTVTDGPVMVVLDISKRFPGVVALDNVSLQFFPGEVHAVVGENGAGKSTLMKIMAGAYTPDSGEIFLNGEKVSFSHPKQAQEKGISIIYQEFNLLPDRTVAHNIFLGREPSRMGMIDVHRMNEQATAVMREIGLEKLISPTALVSSLSVAEQQLVEIAKAISLNARVLIMDEPTAALGPAETAQVRELITQLKSEGIGIFLISHDIHDVFDLADRISVMLQGRLVGTVYKHEVSKDEVLAMIIAGKKPGDVTVEDIRKLHESAPAGD
jgi:ABC-type sugar transport system ATPase subunit